MKILLLNDTIVPIGGAELMTLTLKKELGMLGHDARIFGSSAFSEAYESFGDYECFGTSGALRTLNRAFNPIANFQLKKVLQSFEPDIVHIRMFMTQLSPSILPLLKNIPTIYHASWQEVICPNGLKLLPNGTICQQQSGIACYKNKCLSPQAWVALMFQKKLFHLWKKSINQIVANSEAMKRNLIQNGIGSVEVIHNGVDIQTVRPPLSDPPILSCATRLSREKGIDILIKAFANVIKKIPTTKLIIAGDGPEKNKLVALIQALGLEKKAQLVGHLSTTNLKKQIDPAWVHIVPSICQESFGLTAAEGMMRGTAVVASDIGGLSEIVVDGKTGFLIPPQNEVLLADRILALISDKRLAEKMGKAARERAILYFNKKTCTEKFIKLYKSLIRQ